MAQTSQVDASVPADDVEPDKAEFRANFAAIESELNTLFKATSLERRIALTGFTNTTF